MLLGIGLGHLLAGGVLLAGIGAVAKANSGPSRREELLYLDAEASALNERIARIEDLIKTQILDEGAGEAAAEIFLQKLEEQEAEKEAAEKALEEVKERFVQGSTKRHKELAERIEEYNASQSEEVPNLDLPVAGEPIEDAQAGE
jgi:hypothetical protein